MDTQKIICPSFLEHFQGSESSETGSSLVLHLKFYHPDLLLIMKISMDTLTHFNSLGSDFQASQSDPD